MNVPNRWIRHNPLINNGLDCNKALDNVQFIDILRSCTARSDNFCHNSDINAS